MKNNKIKWNAKPANILKISKREKEYFEDLKDALMKVAKNNFSTQIPKRYFKLVGW